MKYLKPLAAAACATLCAVSLSACNAVTPGKSTLLGEPNKPTTVTYEQITSNEFTNFKTKVEAFASEFASSAYEVREQDGNFAVSPVSVFMALSLAAECADGQTREEILSGLGVTYNQLRDNYATLYNSLMDERTVNGKVSSMLLPSNSIWVNEGTSVNTSCIDALSEYYYACS